MSDKPLIRRDDANLSVSFTEAAQELKNAALETSALVGKVDDAETQSQAVSAQQQIANVLSLAEKARKACKEPVLTFGRLIDSKAAEFSKELKEEQVRLATLVGDFQELENARVRAAQQAENERLMRLERERAEAIRNAPTMDAVEKVQEQFSQRAALEAPIRPIAPIRAEGQRVKQDWDILVTDPWLLARSHPSCVKLEPLVSEIKNLLNAGVKVAGVSAKKIVKAGVSTTRQPAAIDV